MMKKLCLLIVISAIIVPNLFAEDLQIAVLAKLLEQNKEFIKNHKGAVNAFKIVLKQLEAKVKKLEKKLEENKKDFQKQIKDLKKKNAEQNKQIEAIKRAIGLR